MAAAGPFSIAMRTHVDPTQAEKLRALATTLGRVFSAEPVPDEMVEKLRRLEEREREQRALRPR